MDSEQSAYMTAQQKHHRYMIFGKKQRYIEVFQCSGEDMNLVLTGGIPAPVSPAKAAPALLSPGMLPSITPLPPTNIPPPPPPSNTVTGQISQNLMSPSPAASFTWDNPTLLAQHQAQMIAQQNLLVRQNQAQAQNELILMNQITQHNLAVLNQNAGPLSPTPTSNAGLTASMLKPTPYFSLAPHMLPSQHPYVLLPPRMTHLGIPRHQMAYPPHLIPGASPGVIPVVPHVAVKRSYGDAFSEQATPAKRAFHAQGALPVHYQTFYPNI